jgi:hypothetical protein
MIISGGVASPSIIQVNHALGHTPRNNAISVVRLSHTARRVNGSDGEPGPLAH